MWRLTKATEFEVQVRAWEILKSLGYRIRGEVRFKARGKRGIRVDILVLDDSGKPACIVEIKRKVPRRIKPLKQITRYETITGLPTIEIRDFDGMLGMVYEVGQIVGRGKPTEGGEYLTNAES